MRKLWIVVGFAVALVANGFFADALARAQARSFPRWPSRLAEKQADELEAALLADPAARAALATCLPLRRNGGRMHLKMSATDSRLGRWTNDTPLNGTGADACCASTM
jgi:hypothetical protein